LLEGTMRLNLRNGKPHCYQDNCREQAISRFACR
jgi:hypothetical protein